MPEQTEAKKFELTPGVSIIIAGVIIAGAILFTNFSPASSTANNNQNEQEPNIQQQMGPSLYAQIASALGVDQAKYQACVDEEKYKDKIDTDFSEAQKAGGTGTPFTIIYDTVNNKTLSVSGALPYAQFKVALDSIDEQGIAPKIRAPSADDHIIGSPNAPIVLVEYSDFQCPYCQMIHPTLKQLVDESDGKIAWVYRHLPLYTIHPEALPSAHASECVAEQLGNEAFWAFANTLLGS